jgi:hypothetical protein
LDVHNVLNAVDNRAAAPLDSADFKIPSRFGAVQTLGAATKARPSATQALRDEGIAWRSEIGVSPGAPRGQFRRPWERGDRLGSFA